MRNYFIQRASLVGRDLEGSDLSSIANFNPDSGAAPSGKRGEASTARRSRHRQFAMINLGCVRRMRLVRVSCHISVISQETDGPSN